MVHRVLGFQGVQEEGTVQNGSYEGKETTKHGMGLHDGDHEKEDLEEVDRSGKADQREVYQRKVAEATLVGDGAGRGAQKPEVAAGAVEDVAEEMVVVEGGHEEFRVVSRDEAQRAEGPEATHLEVRCAKSDGDDDEVVHDEQSADDDDLEALHW